MLRAWAGASNDACSPQLNTNTGTILAVLNIACAFDHPTTKRNLKDFCSTRAVEPPRKHFPRRDSAFHGTTSFCCFVQSRTESIAHFFRIALVFPVMRRSFATAKGQTCPRGSKQHRMETGCPINSHSVTIHKDIEGLLECGLFGQKRSGGKAFPQTPPTTMSAGQYRRLRRRLGTYFRFAFFSSLTAAEASKLFSSGSRTRAAASKGANQPAARWPFSGNSARWSITSTR